MARKKREIQKRKKQVVSGTDQDQTVRDAGTEPDLSEPSAGGRDKSPETDWRKTQKRSETAPKRAAAEVPVAAVRDTWLLKNRENLLLGLLVIYVLLLGLGTVGELFEIEWILNMPLFK